MHVPVSALAWRSGRQIQASMSHIHGTCAGSRKKAAKQPELEWASRVRLRGRGLARLVIEDDTAVVYHCLSNSATEHASAAAAAPPKEEEGERRTCWPLACMLISACSISQHHWCTSHNVDTTESCYGCR
jgi:hypothetical protein